MDILGIGPLELLFILVIALIVVGPKDLARVGRTLGRTLNRVYRSDSWRILNEASQTIRTLPNRLAREAALDDLDDLKSDVDKARNELESETQKFNQSLKAWTQPTSRDPEPTPEDDQPEKPASEKTASDSAESSGPGGEED
ncbi:MAG: twin-arginine translocase TatA/TatE family subunit [Anaerolineales bacterium]|nr:twin-arginine translocase TatA/TatE family subunit [Anaerolineales bacterium]